MSRNPYVGEGIDGCLRSAEIDRSEADQYASSDPRRDERLASAARWEQQAQHLVTDLHEAWRTTLTRSSQATPSNEDQRQREEQEAWDALRDACDLVNGDSCSHPECPQPRTLA